MRNLIRTFVKYVFLGGRKNTKSPEFYTAQSENLMLRTEDQVSLGSYLVKSDFIPDENTKFFIFCHGKGTEREDATNHAKLRKRVDKNAVFLVVDYRGFSDSTAEFDKRGVNLDITAAFEYLKSEFNPKEISMIGHSYGASIALEYLRYSKENGAGLVPKHLYLFAPLQNLSLLLNEYSVLNTIFTMIPGSESYLFGELEYNSLPIAEKFGDRITIYHGRRDLTVPYQHSEALKSKSERLKLYLTEDGHEEVLENDRMWELLFDEESGRVRL